MTEPIDEEHEREAPVRWNTRGRRRDENGVPLAEFRDAKLPADRERAAAYVATASALLSTGLLGLHAEPADGRPAVVKTAPVHLLCGSPSVQHDAGVRVRVRLPQPRVMFEPDLPLVVEIDTDLPTPANHIVIPGAGAPTLTCASCGDRRALTEEQLLKLAAGAFRRGRREGRRLVAMMP